MSKIISECIYSTFQQVEEKKKESKTFAVKVNDCIGYYTNSLLSTILVTLISSINKYKKVNIFSAASINCGDIIIFTKDDVKLFSSSSLPFKVICNGMKTYNLVEDYYEIIDLVENLYKKDSKLPHKDCVKCPYYNTAKELNNILSNGEFVNNTDKVSIFNNFVKIGYDTYEIEENDTVDINGIVYEVIRNDTFKVSKKESLKDKCVKKLCKKFCR